MTASARRAAAEAAAAAAAANAGGTDADLLGFERNPDYHRVRRQIAEREATGAAAAPGGGGGGSGWPPVPEGETFDLVLATEVLYEMHAAVTLPVRTQPPFHTA